MPSSENTVRVTDVLDPLSGERADVVFEVPGPRRVGGGAVVDGAHLWSLPGLYDADAHLPVLTLGLRESDRWRALAGGATTLNTALPWHLVEPLDLDEVTAFFAGTAFPRILPILSVADDPSSAGFAAWIDKFGDQLRETWMPTIKLYSNDPYFWVNLEAVWAAGCRAAIYFYDEQTFVDVVASRGGPVHFRHVVSQAMYDQVASRPDSTCQTSPHFLVDLPAERPSELHVLPPVPGEPERSTLLEVLAAGVDLIASDHNAPVAGNTGPGLESEQHFLSALLTVAARGPLDLATVIAKTTAGPREVFRPTPELPSYRLLVDPAPTGPAGLWPGQQAQRAPYRGVDLAGTVVAVTSDGQGRFL